MSAAGPPFGAAGTGDCVELSIPVRADLVVLARLAAATIAARADFDVEEIEDLRLAVEELCLSVVGVHRGGRLVMAYEWGDHAIEISCLHEPDADTPASEPVDIDAIGDDLSTRILDALVDEHGRDSRNGQQRAWLRKRRSRINV